MPIKHLLLGMFVKTTTGFDDTITHIPIIASVAKTRLGKLAFSAGILTAIIMAVIISIFFSNILSRIPYYRYIAVGLIFTLAGLIHFDVLVHKQRTKEEKKIKGCASLEKCLTLYGIGFFAALATVIDDIIAYIPIFLEDTYIYATIGIITATIIELTIIIYFSEKVAKIPYKDDIAVVGLVILGLLILSGVI